MAVVVDDPAGSDPLVFEPNAVADRTYSDPVADDFGRGEPWFDRRTACADGQGLVPVRGEVVTAAVSAATEQNVSTVG
jgi:hypothetical protein